MSVTVQHVGYAYTRAQPALRDVSFTAPPGITGIIGPNAAGKSTLLRLIAAIELPATGAITIAGEPAGVARRAGRIGFVPETSLFDEYLQAGEFLTGVAALSGKPLTAVPQTVVDLYERRIETLSLGQRRRVEIAAALIGSPSVLLLDEPTNGLDPFAVADLRETVMALRAAGACVLISSHHLDELQRIADRLVLLRAGECLGTWDRDAALNEFGTVEAMFKTVLGNQTPVSSC
jgi:ABC-type multidrug transport system ATPase subunit